MAKRCISPSYQLTFLPHQTRREETDCSLSAQVIEQIIGQCGTPLTQLLSLIITLSSGSNGVQMPLPRPGSNSPRNEANSTLQLTRRCRTGVHQRRCIKRCASDGVHQMVCIKWRTSDGVHQLVCIRRCASIGVHQLACTKWCASNGVHQMVCINWCASSGVLQMVCIG